MDRHIDPDLLAVVPALPSFDLGDPVATRERMAALIAALPVPPAATGVAVHDGYAPGAAGEPDVRVRLYVPSTAPVPRPAVVLLHGGGFVLGTLEVSDPAGYAVAGRIGAVVASVDYRLAPEHPYPAALEDCYAALAYVHAKAADLGVDPDRVAVMGSSAGGGLAAALALLARDRGGPPVCFQLLDIPELDDRLETRSAREFVDTPVWTRGDGMLSWQHYLGPGLARGGPDVPAYAAPARAGDLAGLPPAYISVCEFDPLRDEGIEYAQRLMHAGVPVELHVYPGTFHGSTSLVPGAPVSRRVIADAHDALARALGVPSPAPPPTPPPPPTATPTPTPTGGYGPV